MISKEDRIKIQAWIDGELAPRESAQIADLVGSSLSAKEFAEDLKTLQRVLENGEKTVKIEESREFYWDQLQQKIDSLRPVTGGGYEKLETKPPSPALQWLIPVGSLAAISALIIHFNDSKIGHGDAFSPAKSIDIEPKSGLTEGSSIGLIEDDSPDGPELGIFSFEGTKIGSDLANPEEANNLPESIENPER